MEEKVIFEIIIIILLLICILLLLKIYFLKKSIKEVESSLNSVLDSDTNNLITISSSDKYLKSLANSLNIELRELRNQKLQYSNGNQNLKKVITNISHDLRTPLTAIKGYIDLIKNEKLSEAQENYLNIINRKSNELTELTEQLYDFSKTVDIGIKTNKENCCINDLLEQSLADHYSIFNEKNITPKIEICEDKVYRFINKTSILRVFENILSNVTKYSNGDFTLSLKPDGKITFSNKASALDETTVQKIFDRYFTVENAKKSSGIGLSIAKQLVELNGGNISAKYLDGYLFIEIEF